MVFEVTSTGLSPYRRWTCLNCPAELRGDTREGAAAHVRATGHPVQWITGSSEIISGLATAVPQEGGGTW